MKTPPPIGTLLAVALLLATAGCAGAAPAGLEGRTFLSTAVADGGADRPLVPGTRIRLTFAEAGNLGASAGCNSIGGTWRIADGVLVFEGGGMTDMGCDEPRHAQDEWLADFLASRPRVALSGNELQLASGSVVVRLLDEEVANPDLPLVGTLWTVDTIISDDMAMGMAGGPAATLRFSADGQVEVFTGCNQGGARVVTDGVTLRFTDLVLTKRACDGQAAQLEEGVLAVLRADAVTYQIRAGSLSLTAGNRGLGLQG